MILENSNEVLINTHKKDDGVTLRGLAEQARDIGRGWKENTVINKNGRNFDITDDMQLLVVTDRGEEKAMDMTDTAFAQLCDRLGVPAKYLRKCAKSGKMDLVKQNISGWADDKCADFVVREHGGVARSIVSTEYVPYDSYKILRSLSHTVNSKRFVPAQVYLSTDKLHVRFVDFTPLPIKGETSPLYAGFCVDSSDVGRGSLSMRYFIYRLACTNGLMISKGGGKLFSLKHAGEKMTESKIERFSHSMRDIDALSRVAVEVVGENQGKKLSPEGLESLLEQAKNKISLSKKAEDKLLWLMSEDGAYDMTRWGFINSITEVAQGYTLDTRVEMESWAGDLLYKGR